MPAGYDEREAQEREDDDTYGTDPRRFGQSSHHSAEVQQGLNDWDKFWAYVPIFGDEARNKQARLDQQSKYEDAQNLIRQLMASAPTAGDLTPEYYQEAGADEYGDMLGGPSALESMNPAGSDQQVAAMSALMHLYNTGGYTDADRRMAAEQRRAAAMQLGQQLRGANEATLQQMGARGMGGSGAELAARLAGSQAMAQSQAGYDANVNAAMMQSAQQRALEALSGYGNMAGQVASQDLQRRQALDAYNQTNLDWRRQREARNTQTANQQQDARVAARQTAYQNREHQAALGTNQYNQGAQTSLQQQQLQQQQANQYAQMIGTVATTLAG